MQFHIIPEGPMDVGHVIPEAIRELLEKRGTFQGWLNRLDDLGNEFRPEVAEKVRTDYAGRLAEVEAELEGHRAELETALAGRVAAVEKVAGEHDRLSAELEETQLRHAVGEFDDQEWERRRAGHQVEIDELEAELTSQREAVDSLQTVLSELAGAGSVAAVAREAETEPPVPQELVMVADIGSQAEEDAPVEASPGDGEGEEPSDDEFEAEESAAAWMAQPFEGLDEDAEVEDTGVADESQEPEADAGDVDEGSRDEVATAEPVDLSPEEAVDEDHGESEAERGEDTDEPEAVEPVPEPAEPGEFMDELEFLESLSLDDADNFDAVSAMLDDEEDTGEEGKTGGKTEDL